MTQSSENVEVSEAQIAAHWREEEAIQPNPDFVAQANMADSEVLERFSPRNFPESFREYADLLTWDNDWHTILDTSDPPFWKWFVGGKLNACYNCVDRHLATQRNKAAFIFVPEPEQESDGVITYQELYVRVNEFAALLRDFADMRDQPGGLGVAGNDELEGDAVALFTLRQIGQSAAMPLIVDVGFCTFHGLLLVY